MNSFLIKRTHLHVTSSEIRARQNVFFLHTRHLFDLEVGFVTALV